MVKCYVDVYNKNYQVAIPEGEKIEFTNKKEVVPPIDGGVTVNSSLATSISTTSFDNIISKEVSDDNRENSGIKNL